MYWKSFHILRDNNNNNNVSVAWLKISNCKDYTFEKEIADLNIIYFLLLEVLTIDIGRIGDTFQLRP